MVILVWIPSCEGMTNNMDNFLKSFSPLLKRLKLKRYFIEIILIIISIIITITSLIIFAKSNGENTNQETIINDQPNQILSGKIFVDVSGSVKKPNLYEMSFGARIKEVIDKAGGLSDAADVIFFNRNFNLARIVTDQEKIYIPSITEINDGIFIQNQLALDYVSPTTTNNASTNTPTDTTNQLISLNSGTLEELDQLPGIGMVTANKIITGRPYSTIDELLTKKIVNKGVFDKIKNLIEL